MRKTELVKIEEKKGKYYLYFFIQEFKQYKISEINYNLNLLNDVTFFENSINKFQEKNMLTLQNKNNYN